jgi:PEGA domain
MCLTKVSSIGVLVFVMVASVAHADPGQDRERRRHDARVVVQPRIVVQPPVVARRYFAPPVRHVVPLGRHWGYRHVQRPGLGFGIYFGSPYGHPYAPYGRPYYAVPYPYPSAYGYSSPFQTDLYEVLDLHGLFGGVRLDVTPRDAAVHVDGYYAGIVDDFDSSLQRLALEPGPHRLEIVAPGYESLVFEVNVRPYQTVQYRGDMRRIVP